MRVASWASLFWRQHFKRLIARRPGFTDSAAGDTSETLPLCGGLQLPAPSRGAVPAQDHRASSSRRRAETPPRTSVSCVISGQTARALPVSREAPVVAANGFRNAPTLQSFRTTSGGHGEPLLTVPASGGCQGRLHCQTAGCAAHGNFHPRAVSTQQGQWWASAVPPCTELWAWMGRYRRGLQTRQPHSGQIKWRMAPLFQTLLRGTKIFRYHNSLVILPWLVKNYRSQIRLR